MRIITLMIAMVAISLQSLAQGINFENLTFEQAVAKAKESKKLVFLDCYTTWCGPCKQMSENVFPQAKAGDYFNPRYVNIKIDMEKGEGPELAKKLGIKAYPTFIVADGNGEIIVKFAGGSDVDGFIKKIESLSKKSFSASNKKYESGKMTLEEKIEYINLLTNASERDKAKEIANDLLTNASKKDKLSKAFWPLFENNRIVYLTTDHFQFIIENKKQFEKIVGKKVVDAKLSYNYFSGLVGDIYGNFSGEAKIKPVSDIEAYIKDIKRSNIEDEDILLAQCNLAIARINNDAVKMAEYMEILLPKINEDNLWGYGSSFLKVFKLDSSAKSNPQVKKLGQKLMDKADSDSKKYYKSVFGL